jgi:hypothetical protein
MLASGQPPDLRELVATIYDFKPRDLDQAGLAAKSAELDRFWHEVKARGSAGKEQLRAELRRADVPPFFSYDGAKLLLSLSQTPEDQKLALSAIARAEVQDLQPGDYFFTVHSLAGPGRDTTAAAFRILTEPDFKVVVPQHALTLDQTSCLMYLLLPGDESTYVPATIRRLADETNAAAQTSLLYVLAYAVTGEADDAIRQFATDDAKLAASRAVAAKLMEHVKLSAAAGTRSAEKLARLRRQRHKELARVSDEALFEIQRLTAEMRRTQTP